MFFRSIPKVSKQYSKVEFQLLKFIQALLGGEPVRYGFFWGHVVVTTILGLVAVSGLLDKRHYQPTFYYLIFQVVLPFLIFWVIFFPFFNVRLPLSEAKQFIVVLPAFFILVSHGFKTWLQILNRNAGRFVIILICCLLISSSMVALNKYWNTGKSPEGTGILSIRPEIESNDAVVSLHHSLTAALTFYVPEIKPYINPQADENGFVFSQISFMDQTSTEVQEKEILSKQRIWLLVDRRIDSEVEKFFINRCRNLGQQSFPPFQISLLEECFDGKF